MSRNDAEDSPTGIHLHKIRASSDGGVEKPIFVLETMLRGLARLASRLVLGDLAAFIRDLAVAGSHRVIGRLRKTHSGESCVAVPVQMRGKEVEGIGS